MKHWRFLVEDLIGSQRRLRAPKPRSPRRVELSCDPLEERMTPSHHGVVHHLAAAVHVSHHVAHNSSGTTSALSVTAPASTVTPPGPGPGGLGPMGGDPSPGPGRGRLAGPPPPGGVGGSHSTNSALTTALKTLQSDVQNIELNSHTTVGDLTAINVAFHALASDGLTPTSRSALTSFENSLVTTNATTPGSLTGNATLLTQFEALYTSSPTTPQTTVLTTAYNDLATAVTNSNINSTDITTINTDWAAVLAALPSTSTATPTPTFPYFTLVTGQGVGVCNGPMGF